jgi:hypothetical protein
VEIAVHLDGRPTAPSASGTEYLKARLSERRRLDAIDAATAGLFRERADVPGRSSGYLVDAVLAARFMRAASAAGAWVTGPWPPFSFVR